MDVSYEEAKLLEFRKILFPNTPEMDVQIKEMENVSSNWILNGSVVLLLFTTKASVKKNTGFFLYNSMIFESFYLIFI